MSLTTAATRSNFHPAVTRSAAQKEKATKQRTLREPDSLFGGLFAPDARTVLSNCQHCNLITKSAAFNRVFVYRVPGNRRSHPRPSAAPSGQPGGACKVRVRFRL